jgi:hypothetical protein
MFSQIAANEAEEGEATTCPWHMEAAAHVRNGTEKICRFFNLK